MAPRLVFYALRDGVLDYGTIRAVPLMQARRQPQGARGNILSSLSRQQFFEFFKMAHAGILYIFERRRGPQTSRGPE